MFFQRQIDDIIQNKLLVLFECVGGDSRRRRGGAKRKTQLTFIGLDECFKIFYLDYIIIRCFLFVSSSFCLIIK